MKKKVIIIISILLVIFTILTILITKNNKKNLGKTSSKILEQNEEIILRTNDETNVKEILNEEKVTVKNKKQEKLINISNCTEEFMTNYYKESQELQKIDNKENIVIAISEKDIDNTFGATKIVKAPNNQYLMQYENKKEKEKAIKHLKDNKNIISVEENHIYKALENNNESKKTTVHTVKSNSSYNSWGIHNTGLDKAKEKIDTEGTENNITVAVIDTGCDISLINSNYSDKIKSAYDVIQNSELLSDMTDNGSHGTHVAGTIAEGTPDNVKILPIKAETPDDEVFYDSDIILAINYIVQDKKADIINMSFGGYYKEKNQAIEQALLAANNEDIICVAAAGNDNKSADNHYPSAFESTISIASFDQKMNKSSFSNYGNTITFSAPGTNIKSVNGIKSGTSMATPHAVCAVSILKSYNKNYNMNEVVEILKKYSIDLGSVGWDKYYGYGAINVEMNYCNCGCENCHHLYCAGCECSNCIFNEKNVLKNLDLINNIDYGSVSDVDVNNLKLLVKYKNGNKRCFNVKNLQNDFEVTESIQSGKYIYGVFRLDNNEFSYKIERPYISDTWEYEKLQGNTIKLTKFKQSNVNTLYIPETIDGYTVTEIGDDLFRYAKNVNGKVTYNNAVKGIKKYILPDSITYIGKAAFLYSDIEELKANIISIGNSCFESCSNLINVNCNKIINIKTFAFNNCDKLEEINLPEGLESIETRAFSDCDNLKKVVLPRSLSLINGNEGGQYAAQDAFSNSSNVILYIYKDTYAHNYAKDTNKRYKLLDAHSFVKVNLNKTEYVAFEKISINNLEIADSEEEYNNGTKETINSSYKVTYQTGANSLRCGDEYCIVTTTRGELLEGKAYVTVGKAQYNLAGNVYERQGTIGQKLEEISLPSGYEWMDKDIVLNEVGHITHKARYTPQDTDNYEIVENVDIRIFVTQDLSKLEVTVDTEDKAYTGNTIKTTILIKDGNKTLVEGTDYTVEYKKNINVGIAEVIIKGKENYTGTINKTFNIVEKNLSNVTVTINTENKIYTGGKIKTSILIKDGNKTLVEGTDYTVEYTNNVNVGTATVTIKGKGNYIGTIIRTFNIEKANYNLSNIRFLDLTATYDGKPHEIIATGVPSGITVRYKNNGQVNVGRYEIIAEFTGNNINYNQIQSMKAILQINAKDISETLISEITDKTYTGKSLTQSFTITDGNTWLRNGMDYKVEYSDNKNIGNASVIVTGIGNYTGKLTKTFIINPKGTSLSKLTAGKKKFTAKWKKQTTQTTGYQIQYSTNKNFKIGNKTVNISKNKTVSKAITKLKAKKKYYVRIRTYKTVSGKKYYSVWSSSKLIKTK